MLKTLSWRRYCGIAMVIILWFTTLTNLYRVRLDIFGNNPLSYLGTDDRSATLFTLGLTLAAIALILFTQYIKYTYKTSVSFLVAVYVGQVGQIIAAFVHFGADQPDRAIHSLAAFALAFSLPIALWRFAVAQTDPAIRKSAFLFFWIELFCFVAGIGLFSFVIKGAPVGQIITALGFHAWVLYFSLRSTKC